jgi:hypothetical protein
MLSILGSLRSFLSGIRLLPAVGTSIIFFACVGFCSTVAFLLTLPWYMILIGSTSFIVGWSVLYLFLTNLHRRGELFAKGDNVNGGSRPLGVNS